MNRAHAERENWFPRTQEERESVLDELRAISASPHFCNSKRYPALLQYLVESVLDGHADRLKERTLGIEVFDRPPSFDTSSDTVVRYTAGEVRKRLQLYYTEQGRNSPIRIALPVGSYVPEFILGPENGFEQDGHIHAVSEHPADPEPPSADFANTEEAPHPAPATEVRQAIPPPGRTSLPRLALWLIPSAALIVAALALWHWRSQPTQPQDPVTSFWSPVLQGKRFVLLCTGGVVFDSNKFSGVVTAGRDVDYPFVSMQNASAISNISGMLERSGASTQLVFAGSESLTGLRENSVALFGAYNNDWTLRLLAPLRFHFTAEPVESIVDEMHPGLHWERDRSQPYSSADDYALLARYRDPTTDGWVVAVSGLGRNGTEAAAQFASSFHYLQLLRRQIGVDFANHNLEVLLKVRVIDGKTGAPSILAVHMW